MKIKIKEIKERRPYAHCNKKAIKFDDKRTKRLRTRAARNNQAIKDG